MQNSIYYYTSPRHVLTNLRAALLKISSFSGCNDPFELATFNMNKGVSYDDRRLFRQRIREWQRRQDDYYGVVCFSSTWRSPLMWAHYARDHTGLCLQFRPDRQSVRQAGHVLLNVQYRPTRLRRDSIPPDLHCVENDRELRDLCATKFSPWRYEKEVRLLVNLRNPGIVIRRGMHFLPIRQCMNLENIFMGYRSQHNPETIKRALGMRRIPVLQTRPAFTKFEIVLQKGNAYRKRRTNRRTQSH